MRTIILTAALLCSASAFAQTPYPESSTTTTTTTTEPATTTTSEPATTTTTTTDTSSQPPAAEATTTTTASAAPTTETGPTTKVIAKGDHYAVHRVLADGTVQVKVLTGEDAKMAMAGKQPAALAAFMNSQPLTAGAGTATPQPEMQPQPQQPQPQPETQPEPEEPKQ